MVSATLNRTYRHIQPACMVSVTVNSTYSQLVCTYAHTHIHTCIVPATCWSVRGAGIRIQLECAYIHAYLHTYMCIWGRFIVCMSACENAHVIRGLHMCVCAYVHVCLCHIRAWRGAHFARHRLHKLSEQAAYTVAYTGDGDIAKVRHTSHAT